jgi:sugar phosphate isomerase/epimerase
MELKLFKTLWGYTDTIEAAANAARQDGFDGLEGPPPDTSASQQQWKRLLDDTGLSYIAEITTAGSYVPDRQATLGQHLDSLRYKLDDSLSLDPVFITCLGGCDAWPEGQNIEFFQRVMELTGAADIRISFETHRGRALFNPWITRRITDQLPDLLLTCDFSHWCVVCERLMDTELDIIERIAPRVQHIHARIGYEQGPQVSDPAAPEYQYALRAHQGWWERIWRAQKDSGRTVTTMTPEFGPDGYLHELPYSREPVADLEQLNGWMAMEERRHFATFLQR